MSNSPAFPALAGLPHAPGVDLAPMLEPYLVEVVIPFSTGTVDEAVRQASIIAQAAVMTAFNAILGNAPTVLDTLEEIDRAIANDPNYATTVATALATKVVKAANLSDLADLNVARQNLSIDKVDNTHDADKSVSTQQQAALDKKLSNVQTEFNAAIGGLLGGWFNQLPTVLPGSAGQWWNNGGVLARS